MILSGILLNVGEKNANGWGINEDGAGDIISSLPGVFLKICNDHAHGCDYEPKTKPGAAIGKVLSAHRSGNQIRISAEVSDPSAELKIRQGKYPQNWSIFASYTDKDKQGYLLKPQAIGVSIVDVPAYPGAGYVAAALDNQLTALDRYYMHPEQSRKKLIDPAEGLRISLEKLHGKYKGR